MILLSQLKMRMLSMLRRSISTRVSINIDHNWIWKTLFNLSKWSTLTHGQFTYGQLTNGRFLKWFTLLNGQLLQLNKWSKMDFDRNSNDFTKLSLLLIIHWSSITSYFYQSDIHLTLNIVYNEERRKLLKPKPIEFALCLTTYK